VTRALAAALLAAALAACGSEDEGPSDRYPGAPTAIAEPPGGSFSTVQYVTLAGSEPGTIHYTTDGSMPLPGAPGTRSGRNPVFWIRAGEGTTTVTFFSIDDAGNRGPVATETYVVEVAP
jgi:hypothetical protein